VSWPILLKFGLARDGQEATSEEDGDMSAEIREWYEAYERNQQQLRAQERREAREEGLVEGLDEGLRRGRVEEAARAVLTALRVRGIEVPDAAHDRILAQKDPERLERWHERAIVAASLAEVLDEPS
jgi:phosphoglycolate phosphatase-like HAD superfamily hydrolase